MLTRKIYQAALLLGLSLSVATATVGCTKKPQVLTADDIPVGSMPEGGDWEGVFYDQTLGFLHLTVQGNSVNGAWRTTSGAKWGELHGTVEGDMLRYTWTERKIGVVGPAAKSEGKGYFKYTLGREDEPHELKGEWGLGTDERGHVWNALKQTNMEPDPKSVRPNEMESRVGAAGFDGAKGDDDIAGDSAEEEEPEGGSEPGDENDPL